MQIRYVLVAVVIGVCGFFLGAWAQDDAPTGGYEMPSWMAKTQQHADLMKSCGKFAVAGEHWMMPGAPAAKFEGTATRKMILGGYFLQEDFDSTWDGQPFQGRLIQGFDTISKEYLSIWIDSTSPFMTVMRGTSTDGVITQTSKTPDMMTGKLKDTKSVVETGANGNITYSAFDVSKAGDDRMTMRLTYRSAANVKKSDK